MSLLEMLSYRLLIRVWLQRPVKSFSHLVSNEIIIFTEVEKQTNTAILDAPHNSMGLDGVEVFTNSSGSHWTLRKLGLRLQLIQEATRKSGGVYIYSNEVSILADVTCLNSDHAKHISQ